MCLMSLSGHEHKYDGVRGQDILAQARRERRAYPPVVCEERTTKLAPKGTAAQWVASSLARGCVARRLQPAAGMRPPRALPQAKLGATNVIVFMLTTTKSKPPFAFFSMFRGKLCAFAPVGKPNFGRLCVKSPTSPVRSWKLEVRRSMFAFSPLITAQYGLLRPKKFMKSRPPPRGPPHAGAQIHSTQNANPKLSANFRSA